ncbi:hypothetical protein [Pseudomonas lactis]|uniref:hypothetical protein n=1 Tax=Pseudomonas lactis TaxID=1615674 RepID=UPI00110D0EB2|nr:hypothetical protein [Pseudomonas lactis]
MYMSGFVNSKAAIPVFIQYELRKAMLASFNMSNERTIIGGYKSQGLIEACATYWYKQILIKAFKYSKLFSCFSTATVPPLLIFIIRGIALISLDIFMLLRAKIKLNEQAAEIYCGEVGVRLV